MDYFIFPDNNSKGRLEDIILEAIGLSENDLLTSAGKFISEVSQNYRSSWSNSNSKEQKAKIGIVGNILMPGAGNTTLLYSNNIEWISVKHKNSISSLEKLYSFLDEKFV